MAKVLDKTSNYIIVKFTTNEYSKIQEISYKKDVNISTINNSILHVIQRYNTL